MNLIVIGAIVAVIIIIVVVIIVLVKKSKEFEATHHKVVKDVGGACSADDANAIVCPADFPQNMGTFTNSFPSQANVGFAGGTLSCPSDSLTALGKNKSYKRYRKHCGTPEATQENVTAGGWAPNQ